MNTISIKNLNTEEKILTMEKLWDALCRQAKTMQSPHWHKTILKSRTKISKSKKAQYSDWDSAKTRIKKSL